MSLNDYRFRSVWRLDAPAHRVFAALEDLAGYPAWWPEIRRAEPVDAGAFELTCRALLPYELVFRTVQERRDPTAGILQASLVGDLDGSSRWTVTAEGDTTTAQFDEEVVARKAALRWLAPIARPAFRANHSLMMRHGEAGLRALLAAPADA